MALSDGPPPCWEFFPVANLLTFRTRTVTNTRSHVSAPTLRIGLYPVMLRTLGPGLHKSLKLLSCMGKEGSEFS